MTHCFGILNMNYYSSNECLRILLLILTNFCALPQPASAKFRICGFRLTMTMTALCKNQLCGGYFIPTKKRSLPDTYELPSSIEQENGYESRRRRSSDEQADDQFDGDYRSLSFQKRYNVAHGQVYGKRSGIASECCEKRCSLAYLRTYCCSSFQIGDNKEGRGQASAKTGGAFSYLAKAPHPHADVKPQMISALTKLGSAKLASTRLQPSNVDSVKTTANESHPQETDQPLEDSEDLPEENGETGEADAEEDANLSQNLEEAALN